jgi:histidine triad (HIT) family protein
MLYPTAKVPWWMVGTPTRSVRRMGGAQQEGRDEQTRCIFCDIVDGRRVADVVWSDRVAVAFLDRSPLFRGHTLVVPRRHAVTIGDLDRDEVGPFFERVQLIAKHMPVALGAGGTFVANNNVVSQSVAHLHVHVIPRTKGDGLRGFFWPRQKYEPGQADEVADRLRRVLGPIRLD